MKQRPRNSRIALHLADRRGLADATIFLGHYAFVEASECPEQLPCRTLDAPLDQFAILDLRVEGYDTIYTRESSEIVPDEHWVNDETLGCR